MRISVPLHKLSGCLVVLAIGLAGCNDSGGGSQGGSGNPAGSNGGIRIVHTAKDAPEFDYYIDGRLIAEEQAYTSATRYIDESENGNVFSGTLQLGVVETGKALSEALASTSVTFGSQQTAIVHHVDGNLGIDLIEEGPKGPTQVRFSHFAEGQGAVDVYFAEDNMVPADIAGLTPVAANVGFGDVNEWLPRNHPSTSNRLWVTWAGETDLILDSGRPWPGQPLSLSTTDAVHVILTHLDSPRGFSDLGGIAVIDGFGYEEPREMIFDRRTRIQVIHAASDAGPLSFTFGPEPASDVLEYREGSVEIELAGSNTRTFRAFDAQGNEVHSSTQHLARGRHIVYVLSGSDQADELRIDRAISRPQEHRRTGHVAAYAFHGYGETTIDFRLEIEQERPFQSNSIYAAQSVLDSHLLPVDQPDISNGVTARFYTDCCDETDLINSKEFNGLANDKLYAFVLGGLFISAEDESEVFIVEAPWAPD